MKYPQRYSWGVTLFLMVFGALLQAQTLSTEEQQILKGLDDRMDQYADMAKAIWDVSELGFMEDQSTAVLQNKLKEAGFKVESGLAGMPTSFIGSWGSGKPVIGLLAEYDALPGMSQAAVPYKESRSEVNAGHACGHHLFGAGSVAAAIAIKEWLEKTGTSGTVRLYGTPAEEGGGGKVYMVREGLFDDVDAVLTWHPSQMNASSAESSLAVVGARFRFYGIASHAAASPWNGRSALDGIESMNHMVNMMREHVPPQTRIHYAIFRGGEAPNVVPAYAESSYYVRHPNAATLKEIFARVVKAAEGAALGTGTRMEYEMEMGYYEVLPNEPLSQLMYDKLKQVGGVQYTPEERNFAVEIMKTYDHGKMTPESAMEIAPYTVNYVGTFASSDVGDISWVTPTASLAAATWVPGTSAHSWQAVAAGGTSIGAKGMMVAAKTIALSAVEIYKNPAIAEKAMEKFRQLTGDDFRYESLVGDRKPPLDYRKK